MAESSIMTSTQVDALAKELIIIDYIHEPDTDELSENIDDTTTTEERYSGDYVINRILC